MHEASFGTATVADPTMRGEEPYSLERRIQMWVPPIETRMRSRTVWSSMLSNGSRASGPADCGLAAQVAIHLLGGVFRRASRATSASWRVIRRKQARTQFRSLCMRWSSPLNPKTSDQSCSIGTLLHCRVVGRTHVDLIHSIVFVHFVYDRDSPIPVLWKSRVGVERRPILFRFFSAGMSHKVDERVRPGRIILGHPVTENIEIVLVL